MIERGDTQKLSAALRQFAPLNRSTVLSDTAENTSPTKNDDRETITGAGLTCMRHDRHFSALVFACFMNKLDCFKILYEHGKMHSKSNEDEFLQSQIGGQQERKECLFYAVANKNSEFLTYLVGEVGLKISLEEKNEKGETLLHIAAEKGDDRMIYLLCEGA